MVASFLNDRPILPHANDSNFRRWRRAGPGTPQSDDLGVFVDPAQRGRGLARALLVDGRFYEEVSGISCAEVG